LAAFGQPGVERVLDMLRAELGLVMKQCGARSVAEISTRHVARR
jgi:isopentenyl diphosphate isomerase/L-lactate dehydrogenase-like FMN-dependent dehydrogenase